jgi:hypothetical protein
MLDKVGADNVVLEGWIATRRSVTEIDPVI